MHRLRTGEKCSMVRENFLRWIAIFAELSHDCYRISNAPGIVSGHLLRSWFV